MLLNVALVNRGTEVPRYRYCPGKSASYRKKRSPDRRPGSLSLRSFTAIFVLFRLEAAFRDLYGQVCTAACSAPQVGMQRYDADGKTFVHLLNYDYDQEKDVITVQKNVEIRLSGLAGDTVRVFTLDGETDDFTVTKAEDSLTVTLSSIPVYTVIIVE